jgi:parallel beta-helix repeat protein
MVEGSSAVRVVSNLVLGNQARGIYVAASEDTLVCANTVSGTQVGAAIDCSGMPRSGKRLAHVRVVDNLLVDNLGRDDLLLLRENGRDIVDLRVDHDLFWRAGGAASIWWGDDARTGWSGASYHSLSGWASVSDKGAGCVQADPRLRGWVPSASSPADGAGARVDGVTNDNRGTAFADPPTIGALQPGAPLAGEAWAKSTWSGSPVMADSGAPAHRCGIASALGALVFALGLAALGQRRPAARSTSATRSGSPPAER